MRYSEDLDIPWGVESGLSVTPVDKDQLGFSIIYIAEKSVHEQAQNATFWAIRSSLVVSKLTGWFHIHLFLFI